MHRAYLQTATEAFVGAKARLRVGKARETLQSLWCTNRPRHVARATHAQMAQNSEQLAPKLPEQPLQEFDEDAGVEKVAVEHEAPCAHGWERTRSTCCRSGCGNTHADLLPLE
jgi:hypothetical protein